MKGFFRKNHMQFFRYDACAIMWMVVPQVGLQINYTIS